MAAPEIALVKAWSRIDGAEFDAILPTMITAATALASHETGVDYTVAAMPAAVQQWACAQVSYWIDNPGAASDRTMDPSPFLARLLDPYRTYTWTDPVVV